MALTWLKYVDRSYQQIKDSVITQLQSRVPEITDHTESNLYVKMIGIWAGIAEMLGYYVDNKGQESYIGTCRLYSSAIKIARSFDYRVHSAIPSSGNITFYISNPAVSIINIPLGTEVQTATGLRYFTTVSGSIQVGDTEVTIPAVQQVLVTGVSAGVSDGTGSQLVVVNGNKIADNTVLFRVNGLAWNRKETLGFSLGTAQDYVQTVNEEQEVVIQLGDNYRGLIPTAGDVFTTDYYITEGSAGNVSANAIATLVTVIPTGANGTLNVTNREATSGGNDIESLKDLKYHIPLSIRTLYRAVTEQDYIDVAELASGVAKAGIVFGCGKEVEVYIVPDGGGIASNMLLAATQTWMDDRKMITTNVVVKAAGEVHIRLVIDLNVKPSYDRVVVSASVIANLTEFISFENQQINGKVELGDVYEVIENTEGVEYSFVQVMTSIPYARPLDTTTTPLNWTKVVNLTSTTTKRWVVIMTSATTYQLFQDISYVGTYSTGVLISMPEIDFTINAGGYVNGDSWEFYTYPYNGTLDLTEPSLPVTTAGDITLNVSGGL